MSQIVKKSHFTLLELLIVLFIISFGVILTGVKVRELYQEQRFLSESQQVLSHLAMAQDLMLILDADVQMKIATDSQTQQVTFRLEVEKPLEEAWSRLIERKILLSAIHSYEFEGRHDNALTLHFSLGHMSQGVLTLFEGARDDPKLSDKRQFQIELAGYPRAITAQSSPSKEENQGQRSQLLYPTEVYEQLYADPSQKNPVP